MTGFGRSEATYEGKKITLELKSLNSKSFDLNLKIPARYREKEFEIRKILNERILRGKVDCYLNLENLTENSEVSINESLIQNYMQSLKQISPDGPDFEYLKMAVRLPDAVSNKTETIGKEESDTLLHLLRETLDRFEEFRQTEGQTLQNELLLNLRNIEKSLNAVSPYEEERLVAVKEKYRTTLKEFDQIDETRFYQEMAYYTEKLDISEEKVRLGQHLKYYQEVLENEVANGKKLGFIAQEIGREINTLGSKANHADIQKLVVAMKDDLEKIKEQTLNVL